MTARRRRKSGSGPSATALIAWVGGAQVAPHASPGALAPPAPVQPYRRVPTSRAVLVGRACGLAAGTLLACGSVLASATHVGDGSLAEGGAGNALLPNTLADPPMGATPAEAYQSFGSPQREAVAPEPVSTQAFVRTSRSQLPRSAQVRRNAPMVVDVPAAASSPPGSTQRPWEPAAPPASHPPANPIAPVNPVLDPAESGVGRLAPVGGVLAPQAPGQEAPRQERVCRSEDKRTPQEPTSMATTKSADPLGHVIAPLEQAAQPAISALTSLLPLG
jgi:hypothetical protein